MDVRKSQGSTLVEITFRDGAEARLERLAMAGDLHVHLRPMARFLEAKRGGWTEPMVPVSDPASSSSSTLAALTGSTTSRVSQASSAVRSLASQVSAAGDETVLDDRTIDSFRQVVGEQLAPGETVAIEARARTVMDLTSAALFVEVGAMPAAAQGARERSERPGEAVLGALILTDRRFFGLVARPAGGEPVVIAPLRGLRFAISQKDDCHGLLVTAAQMRFKVVIECKETWASIVEVLGRSLLAVARRARSRGEPIVARWAYESIPAGCSHRPEAAREGRDLLDAPTAVAMFEGGHPRCPRSVVGQIMIGQDGLHFLPQTPGYAEGFSVPWRQIITQRVFFGALSPEAIARKNVANVGKLALSFVPGGGVLKAAISLAEDKSLPRNCLVLCALAGGHFTMMAFHIFRNSPSEMNEWTRTLARQIAGHREQFHPRIRAFGSSARSRVAVVRPAVSQPPDVQPVPVCGACHRRWQVTGSGTYRCPCGQIGIVPSDRAHPAERERSERSPVRHCNLGPGSAAAGIVSIGLLSTAATASVIPEAIEGVDGADEVFFALMDVDGHIVGVLTDGQSFLVDTDADGLLDTFLFDADMDGTLDTIMVDFDQDGVIDAVGIDVDGDGAIDVVGVDVDGDGLIDATGVDIDGDGVLDIFDSF